MTITLLKNYIYKEITSIAFKKPLIQLGSNINLLWEEASVIISFLIAREIKMFDEYKCYLNIAGRKDAIVPMQSWEQIASLVHSISYGIGVGC